MAEITPITREEFYLAKAGGQDVPVPSAVTREEYYLEKLSNDSVVVPSPVTRREKFLYFACGGEIDLPSEEKMTRLERLIAKAGGMDVSTPTAVTRLEKFWVNVEGGGWKTITGTLPLTFRTSETALRSWTIYGNNTPHIATSTGVLPLTFTTTEDKLRDWVIYGNDDNGTENLFDISTVVDGYINAYGVLTAGSQIQAEKASDYIEIDGSTTYTFSAVGGFPSRTGYQGWRSIAYYDSNKSFLARTASEGATDLSATSRSTAKYARISYRSYGEANLQMMLVKGSTAPDHYIPYQQGVGERTENLAENIENGSWSPTGFTKQVNPIRCRVSNIIDIDEGAIYTIFGKTTGSISGTYLVQFKQDDGTSVSESGWKSFGTSVSASTGATKATVLLALADSSECHSTDFANIMLIKGSTAPSSYVPYGYEIPISTQGENLFDISTMIDPDSAGKYLKNDGTTGNEAFFSYTTYIPIAAQRVRLDNVTGGAAAICCYDANKNFIRGQMYYQQSVILLNTSDAAFVRFSLKPAMETNAALFGLNDYTFYIGNTPLRAGQSISKTSTGVDIATTEGENTISTTLYNKPETAISYVDYLGVGEKSGNDWQIPLTISDGTNTTSVNVPIDAPLTEGQSVTDTQTINTFEGENTIDTMLTNKPQMTITYKGG